MVTFLSSLTYFYFGISAVFLFFFIFLSYLNRVLLYMVGKSVPLTYTVSDLRSDSGSSEDETLVRRKLGPALSAPAYPTYTQTLSPR